MLLRELHVDVYMDNNEPREELDRAAEATSDETLGAVLSECAHQWLHAHGFNAVQVVAKM